MLYLAHFSFSADIFADFHARDALKYVWMQSTFGVKLPELLYSRQKNGMRKQENMYIYLFKKKHSTWDLARLKNDKQLSSETVKEKERENLFLVVS